MECVKLFESLDILGYAGVCVGSEQSQILRSSLLILQKENHFRKCYYWGRINGIQNDYHIAYGFQRDCMSQQTYYYSTDGLTWLLLPKINKCGSILSPLVINQFVGEPSMVTNVYENNLPFPVDKNPKEYCDGTLMKELKEEDRLAATVGAILEDAVVLPRGGWFKHPNGKVIENSNFQGLDVSEAWDLRYYLHARPPRQRWTRNLLSRPDYNYTIDFLDPIDLDVPRRCWSLQSHLGNMLVILHSLHWPGMYFYHKLSTPHYGFLYIGDGKKNVDLPFML